MTSSCASHNILWNAINYPYIPSICIYKKIHGHSNWAIAVCQTIYMYCICQPPVCSVEHVTLVAPSWTIMWVPYLRYILCSQCFHVYLSESRWLNKNGILTCPIVSILCVSIHSKESIEAQLKLRFVLMSKYFSWLKCVCRITSFTKPLIIVWRTFQWRDLMVGILQMTFKLDIVRGKCL